MYQSRKHTLNFLKTFKHFSELYDPKLRHFKILVASKKKTSNATHMLQET